MKKTFIPLCLLIITFCSFGQSFHLGVLAGENTSSFFYRQINLGLNESSPSDNITGFHAGVFAEFTYGNFSIEPEVVYASIGGKSSYDVYGPYGASTGTYKNSVNYLQVPVNLLRNIPVSFGKIFCGGGPYIGFGLSGKTENTGEIVGEFGGNAITNVNSVTKYSFSSPDNPDFGVNLVVGIHLKNRLLFRLGYNYGLKYLFNYSSPHTSGYIAGVDNSVASISVGYAFL